MNRKKAIIYLLPIVILIYLYATRPRPEIHQAIFRINNTLSKSADLALIMSRNQESEIAHRFRGNKEALKPIIYGAMDQISAVTDDFVDKVEELKDYLIDQTGDKNHHIGEGDYNKYHFPIGYKDRYTTSKIMISDGKAEELASWIILLRESLIEIYNYTLSNELVRLQKEMTAKEFDEKIVEFDNFVELKLTEDYKSGIILTTKLWAKDKFSKLPLSAVLALLTKYQTDAQNARAMATRDIAGLLGIENRYRYDNIIPIMHERNGYVAPGDTFESSISIVGYTTESVENSSITVNGVELKLNDRGFADYTETIDHYGRKELNVTAAVTDQNVGYTTASEGVFEYQIGERAASLFLSNTNVFYIGINNPFEVAIAGTNYRDLKVFVTSGECKLWGKEGRYTAKVFSEGMIELRAWSKNYQKTFRIEVKKLPDPVIKWKGKKSGLVSVTELIAHPYLMTKMEAIPINVDCPLISYQVVLCPRKKSPIKLVNKGASFSVEVLELIKMAEVGDFLYFNKVKVECPQDSIRRILNSLIFEVKP